VESASNDAQKKKSSKESSSSGKRGPKKLKLGNDALDDAVQSAAADARKSKPARDKAKDSDEDEGSGQESDDDGCGSNESSENFARDGDFVRPSDDDSQDNSGGEDSEADGSFDDEEDLTGGRKLKKARSSKVQLALSRVIRFVSTVFILEFTDIHVLHRLQHRAILLHHAIAINPSRRNLRHQAPHPHPCPWSKPQFLQGARQSDSQLF
jgi:hypothetical protein